MTLFKPEALFCWKIQIFFFQLFYGDWLTDFSKKNKVFQIILHIANGFWIFKFLAASTQPWSITFVLNIYYFSISVKYRSYGKRVCPGTEKKIRRYSINVCTLVLAKWSHTTIMVLISKSSSIIFKYQQKVVTFSKSKVTSSYKCSYTFAKTVIFRSDSTVKNQHSARLQ